jgi:hypothetical protein
MRLTPDEFEFASEMADDLDAKGDHYGAWALRSEMSASTVVDLANTPMGTSIENGPAVPGGVLFFGDHKVQKKGGKYLVTLNHADPGLADPALYGDPDEAAAAVRAGEHTGAARPVTDGRQLGLANDYGLAGYSRYIGLSNQVFDREAARHAEDAAPLPARSEDRLSAAMARVARRTYTPQGEYAWGLANEPGRAGPVTGAPNCGASDDLGHCIERYHSAGCGSTADPETALALAASDAYIERTATPWADARGRTWESQYGGEPMDLVQHLESATGIRLASPDPFDPNAGRRETFRAQRQDRFGDPDDDRDPGFAVPAATRATAAAFARQQGLDGADVRSERARYRGRREEMLAEAGRRNRHLRNPDYSGETSRDRAERLHRTAEPVLYDDGSGVLRYVAG